MQERGGKKRVGIVGFVGGWCAVVEGEEAVENLLITFGKKVEKSVRNVRK